MIKSILVTGKNGQLGQSLAKVVDATVIPSSVEKSPAYRLNFTFVDRKELDLANPQSIRDYFKAKQFDAIVNCGAYTAVDKSESEPELADQINHLAVKQLAEIAKQQNSVLIHISTDYVFDGTNHKPYLETDKTNPINIYGLTKLKGELAMQAINPKGAVIRTSWVYSEFGNNFVKTMLRLGKERDNLNVIFDQVGSPTYATDLANAILVMLKKCFTLSETESTTPTPMGSGKGEGECSTVQTYHYSNEGVCSWYDFAKAIFDIANISCQVNPIETKEYPTPAKRPHYSVMNKFKISQIPALVVPYWRQSLQKCLGLIG